MSEEATLDEFVNETAESQNNQDQPIPDGWQMARADEIMEITRGASPRPKGDPELFGGDIPWVKIGDVDVKNARYTGETEDTVTEKGAEKSKLVDSGTLLVSNSGTCGYPMFAGVESCVHDGWLILRDYEESLNPHYFYEFINWKQEYLKSLAPGSTQINLNTSRFGVLEINIPPLSEQSKIATVLYTVDQAIEKTEKIIDRNQKLKKGIRQDIFQHGGLSDEKTIPRRIGPKEYEMPEDWEITNLSQVAEIKGGQGFKSANYVDEGVPLVKISNVQNGYLDLQDTSYLPEEYLDEYSEVALSTGDVVLVLTRPIIGDGIKAARIDREDRFLLNQRLAVVDPLDEDTILREYLYHLIFTSVFIDQVKATVRATHQPNLSKTDLQNFSIPIPEIEQQRDICKVLRSVEDTVEKNKSYRANLKRTKRGLMQDLLSGTVRTTDTNIEVPEEIAQYG